MLGFMDILCNYVQHESNEKMRKERYEDETWVMATCIIDVDLTLLISANTAPPHPAPHAIPVPMNNINSNA